MTSLKKFLIIFTRYPELGKTKTRLIPAIGAEKAMDLQRLMTEKTVNTAQLLKDKINIEIYIYFSGGNVNLMKNWLGNEYKFYPQQQGDLGLKMYSAFQDVFTQGSHHIIIIGIDCPQLNIDILTTAFNRLNSHDLVIGKATDGGYYLLGLNYLEKQFFLNINWGSNQVFSQTMAIAHKLNYRIYQLPTLPDIDRPEDLRFWHNEIKE